MIDINDLEALEKYFSENLKSPLFPILSDLYFQKGDYQRSEKVCDIGLKNNPNSSIGYYILAKINLINENLTKAEKNLEKSIFYSPINLSAKNLLFFVQKELNRSKVKIKKNVLEILSIDSKNQDCLEWININYKNEHVINQSKRPVEKETNKKENFKIKKQEQIIVDEKDKQKSEKKYVENNNDIDINPELASITLFNIYKSQGYYDQALQVLYVLKDREKKKKKIIEEINILKNLINENK